MKADYVRSFEYMNHLSGIVNSVANPAKKQALVLYPNPARNVLRVDKLEEGTPYQIWNMSGQLIQEGNLSNNEIALTKGSAGLYLIRFSNGVAIKFRREDY